MSSMHAISSLLSSTLNTSSVSVNNKFNNTNNTKTLKHSVTDVRRIALNVSDKLNNPSRVELYYKFAWQLTEQQICANLEVALAGRNPKRYFTWLCQRNINEKCA